MKNYELLSFITVYAQYFGPNEHNKKWDEITC